MNPWLTVVIVGACAFAAHILFVLAFRSKH